MKKYEDFSENNAFFQEKNELTELPNLDKSLVESENRSNGGEAQSEKGVRFFSLGILMIVAAAAIVCILIFVVASREPQEPTATEPQEQTDEWRGAFLEQSIYEECAEASVKLCVGKYAIDAWSGFLVSSDGWIATSEQMLDDFPKGRIYATLCDGREYAVDKVLRRERVALLKISASELGAVSFDGRELQGGERVIAVNAGGEVLSGEISSPQTQRVNISCGIEWEGAPLYDEEGRLAGMICSRDDGAVYSASVEEIESVFWTAKQK